MVEIEVHESMLYFCRKGIFANPFLKHFTLLKKEGGGGVVVVFEKSNSFCYWSGIYADASIGD